MFKIDLLKGQGIPPRRGPGGIAIIAVTVTIPVAAAIAMFGSYLHSKIVVSIKQQEVVRWEAEVDKLSGAVELQKALEKEKIVYGDCLSEVKSSINKHTQWSPVLTTLIKDMPDSVVLTELGVEYDSVKRQVPKKDDPQKMIEIDVPVRILRLSVSGSPQSNCDEAVKAFQNRIRSSAILGPRLENIGVSQKFETLKDRDVVSYQINCVFKPGL